MNSVKEISLTLKVQSPAAGSGVTQEVPGAALLAFVRRTRAHTKPPGPMQRQITPGRQRPDVILDRVAVVSGYFTASAIVSRPRSRANSRIFTDNSGNAPRDDVLALDLPLQRPLLLLQRPEKNPSHGFQSGDAVRMCRSGAAQGNNRLCSAR